MQKVLDSMAWGMIDSYHKPHHLLEGKEKDDSPVWLGRVYNRREFYTLWDEYVALFPAHLMIQPGAPPAQAQAQAALAQYNQYVNDLPGRINAIFDAKVQENAAKMRKVIAIEKAVRAKAQQDKEERKKKQLSRKQFFETRAAEDLQDIPLNFLPQAKSFNAATKISRDGGTHKSWEVLKKKIVREWEEAVETNAAELEQEREFMARENAINDIANGIVRDYTTTADIGLAVEAAQYGLQCFHRLAAIADEDSDGADWKALIDPRLLEN
jgi:hypothetical protein